MSDSNAQGIMGIQALKQKAKNYLEDSDANAVKQALADTRQENENLRGIIEEMNKRLEAVENKPKRRGRPPKED